MLGRSPWHRFRRGALLLAVALVALPLGAPAVVVLGAGLVGALLIAAALNPAPGRGRGPDLR